MRRCPALPFPATRDSAGLIRYAVLVSDAEVCLAVDLRSVAFALTITIKAAIRFSSPPFNISDLMCAVINASYISVRLTLYRRGYKIVPENKRGTDGADANTVKHRSGAALDIAAPLKTMVDRLSP